MGEDSQLNRFCKTADLYSWMNTEGDFNESIKKEVQAYFEHKDMDIKSFVSIPLLNEEDKTIAILNIHKTTEDILSNDKKLQIYHDTMKPMLRVLSELVGCWNEKR